MDSCKDYISTQALGGQDERVQLRVAVDNTRTNLVPLLPPDRNAKIVDEACSYGRYLKALRDLGYTDTLGIDLSAEQVAFARDRLRLTCASLDAPTPARRNSATRPVALGSESSPWFPDHMRLRYLRRWHLYRKSARPGKKMTLSNPASKA